MNRLVVARTLVTFLALLTMPLVELHAQSTPTELPPDEILRTIASLDTALFDSAFADQCDLEKFAWLWCRRNRRPLLLPEGVDRAGRRGAVRSPLAKQGRRLEDHASDQLRSPVSASVMPSLLVEIFAGGPAVEEFHDGHKHLGRDIFHRCLV